MSNFYSEAFYAVCKEAKTVTAANIWYVCLMESIPYYGGPEEGGWYGRDNVVVAYQECLSEHQAQTLADEVHKLALELTENERRSYGERCLFETEWLEARGLDDSYLPEPDGPSEFSVCVFNEFPANTFGPRQYS